MAATSPFEANVERYEAWFGDHEAAYLSELLALRASVPCAGRGLEIGVGTGRFAAPLGVQVGVDPSPAMLARAAARGIEAVEGVAEQLPFADASFDHALFVTTLCFVESPAAALAEVHRVLRPGGRLAIGFIDRDSALGRHYLAHQHESVFYREATFLSAGEVAKLLAEAGFAIDGWGQTLSRPLAETREIEAVRPGHGQCAFVVVSATSVRLSPLEQPHQEP
jgi:SAM-dependent methyltransferase